MVHGVATSRTQLRDFTFLLSLQVTLLVRNPPARSGGIRDTGSIPVSGRSPEGGQGNTLQYLAWGIPWTEEPGGLQSTGLKRVRHD